MRIIKKLTTYIYIPFLVVSAIVVSSPVSALENTNETLYSIQNYYLGLIKNNQLITYSVDDSGQWELTDNKKMTVAKDTLRIVTNQRRTIFINPQGIDFYDEQGKLKEKDSIKALPKNFKASRVVTGLFSTESELLYFSDDAISALSTNAEPKILAKIKCPEAMNAKIYGFTSSNFYAAVTQEKASIFSLKKEGKDYVCKVVEVFTPPKFSDNAKVDEIFIFDLDKMGVRTGKVVKFYSYDADKKAWVSASDKANKTKDTFYRYLPDFVIQ